MEIQNRNYLFYETCRLCLKDQGYCDIFDRTDLQENILRCFGLKVSLADSMPQKICAKCLEIVTKAAELRTIARKNDEHLKKLFNYPETEPSMDICEEDEDENENALIIDEDERNPAIEKFISVRKDLFDSSVSEASVMKKEIYQYKMEAPKKQEYGKIVKCDNGVTIYQCNKCPKKFKEWKKLYLHNRLHNKNYRCPIVECVKKFATKGDLEKHLRTHTGEKPYECDQCDKSFAQRVTLKTHKETVHSEGEQNRNYSCTIAECGKKFVTKGDLEKHVRTHSGEKPYKCDVCDKCFAQRGTLKTHKETVHSEGEQNRNYSCTIAECGKKFVTKGDLEKHVRTHSGEKPYKCDVCDKCFARRGTLKTHKGNVHSEKKSATDT